MTILRSPLASVENLSDVVGVGVTALAVEPTGSSDDGGVPQEVRTNANNPPSAPTSALCEHHMEIPPSTSLTALPTPGGAVPVCRRGCGFVMGAREGISRFRCRSFRNC